MASAEQPLKKRKLYEPPPPSNANDEQAPPPPRTPPPLSHEEILRRRRNHEEIRSVYESYKTIKRCISNGKDARHMAELEQAYLSLISASRGCASVHRILSEFIPRYAAYCPTALEAAAQVIIYMHNCNIPVITRGEDTDGVSFDTAKNCIIGLVDICCTASLEAPSSSVIRRICSAVFLNVVTFFASSIEGNDIFQVVDIKSLKMQDCETYCQLKQCVLEEDASPFIKLLKLRALCLLRISFLCPKDLLAAFFELVSNHAAEGFCREAKFILHLLSSALNSDGETCFFDGNGAIDIPKASSSYMEVDTSGNEIKSRRQESNCDHFNKSELGLLKHCLLGEVLQQDYSLKKWMFSRYKRLRKSASSEAMSQVTIAFEGIFESFTELVKIQDNVEDSDDDGSDSSKYDNGQYLVRRISDQHNPLYAVFGKDSSLRIHGKSCKEELANKISGHYLKGHGSLVSLEGDCHSNNSCNDHSGSLKCMSFDGKEQGDRSHVWSSMPNKCLGDQLLSPVLAKPSDIKSGLFEQGEKAVQVGALNAKFAGVTGSPRFGNNPALYYPSASSQIVWYSDGDPAAMDVFSATRQLWLGVIAPDTSEAAVRFEFERFGPIENFSFVPAKGFALAEYRSITDAIKAREFMRRYSRWGYPVRIKFVDVGLGTRGAVGGVAIGSSCHVFVGNVLNQWAKDEIMQEIMKAICRGPCLVTDLTNEGALLLEFDTPEEAANAMACIRLFRRGINNATVPTSIGVGPTIMSSTHPNYWNEAPAPVGNLLGNACNNLLGSPLGQTVGSPTNRLNIAGTPFKMKPEGIPPELVSPTRVVFEQGFSMQGAQVTQSNMASSGCTDTLAIGISKAPPEQMWMYWKPEHEKHSAAGSVACTPAATQGHTIAPPQAIEALPYIRPVYPPPTTNSWDTHGLSPHLLRPMHTGIHSSTIPPPFVQASVTPLSQIPATGFQPYSQVAPQPIMPPLPPLQSDMPPPLPPSPPMVPPPPSSPPPPPPPPAADPPPPAADPPPSTESSKISSTRSSLQIQWQGALAKSGVHYCTVCAHRVDLESCKYSISVSEPTGWPVKLDMTKRTDFRHVKAAFTNTQPTRREVCELVPSSAADKKGFQDFISYLKQRDCAGVIKISAMKSVWGRLLFILPYSVEACSMLSIKPKASDCLIAIVLPKEANSECP